MVLGEAAGVVVEPAHVAALLGADVFVNDVRAHDRERDLRHHVAVVGHAVPLARGVVHHGGERLVADSGRCDEQARVGLGQERVVHDVGETHGRQRGPERVAHDDDRLIGGETRQESQELGAERHVHAVEAGVHLDRLAKELRLDGLAEVHVLVPLPLPEGAADGDVADRVEAKVHDPVGGDVVVHDGDVVESLRAGRRVLAGVVAVGEGDAKTDAELPGKGGLAEIVVGGGGSAVELEGAELVAGYED